MGSILANTLADTDLAAFDLLDEQRWNDFDISQLLFLNFDTCSAKLPPIYAEQYGIAEFVTGEAQTRAFLKKVIALYRKKGTPWAMKEALTAVGWPGATILEGAAAAPIIHNAEIKHDGSQQHGGGSWALFRVVIPLRGAAAPAVDVKTRLVALINEFRPARCQLVSLTFQ